MRRPWGQIPDVETVALGAGEACVEREQEKGNEIEGTYKDFSKILLCGCNKPPFPVKSTWQDVAF